MHVPETMSDACRRPHRAGVYAAIVVTIIALPPTMGRSPGYYEK